MDIALKLQAKWAWWNIKRKIRKHGWTGVYVGDYSPGPAWAYSIGFDETLDQPEVIGFDLPRPTANEFIAAAYHALKSKTLVLEDGLTWPEDIELPGVWRKVHPSRLDGSDEHLTLAMKRRLERTGRIWGLEAFQLVVSDDGVLPWDDGYDERLRRLQPALWEPAEAKGEP